jgi:hypothetical protein
VVVIRWHALDPAHTHASDAGRLSTIGNAFRQDCRDYDEVGYLGANTFAVVLPGMKVANLSDKFAGLLRAASAELDPSLSAGVEAGSSFYPDDTDDARQLLVIASRRITGHATFLAGLQALHEKTRAAVKAAPKPAGAQG